jgi:hypothetical protein
MDWQIQRAIAPMIEALAKLDCPTDDSFATDLLDELKKSDAILASRTLDDRAAGIIWSVM